MIAAARRRAAAVQIDPTKGHSVAQIAQLDTHAGLVAGGFQSLCACLCRVSCAPPQVAGLSLRAGRPVLGFKGALSILPSFGAPE